MTKRVHKCSEVFTVFRMRLQCSKLFECVYSVQKTQRHVFNAKSSTMPKETVCMPLPDSSLSSCSVKVRSPKIGCVRPASSQYCCHMWDTDNRSYLTFQACPLQLRKHIWGQRTSIRHQHTSWSHQAGYNQECPCVGTQNAETGAGAQHSLTRVCPEVETLACVCYFVFGEFVHTNHSPHPK